MFLDLNGFDFDATEDEAYEALIGVARSEIAKPGLTRFFIRHSGRDRSGIPDPPLNSVPSIR
ncbi:MAG: hypothetical protein KBC36_02200 [Spirochaetia bacterium]|nr:hypothetical protein [Spirochaetia bacterium]